MKPLIFLTAGAHARVALEIFAQDSGWRPVGFLDDSPQAGLGALPRLGPLEQLREMPAGCAFVGMANIRLLDRRRALFEQGRALGWEMACAIHPRAFISPSAQHGSGLFLGPMAVVHTASRLGHNVCIYSGSVVEHDARVEDHVFLGPGVHLAGGVSLLEGAYLSVGARVGWGLTIGRNALVAAGAVVVRDVPEGAMVMGAPARVVGTVQEWLEKPT
ncbi:MAG: NeuD/PglB/VioB family sugar acetyltransferase [Vulcanimicrobiota bacterium]